MGKTSILYQLLNQPPTPRHICVFYSLELEIPQSMAELLFTLARSISDALLGAELSPPVPDEREFAESPQRAFVRFFNVTTALLGDRRLLIMMDEFDKVIHKVEGGALSEDVYAFLRGLWQHTEKAAFIITGAYKVREMLKDNRSILFHVAKPYQISYLGPKEAQDLIVRPVQGMLTYDNMVVDKILRVTACHPYFVQYICDSLVRLGQTLRKNWLFLPDLNLVLKEVIEDNAGVLQNAIYAPLSRAERTVLAALATITDDRTVLVPWEAVAEALYEHTLEVAKPSLFGALCSLSERDLVVEKRIGRGLQYGFRMDLIRMWLRQNNMLLRLSQEQRL
jgi:type I restriction enzyme M protein